MDKAKEFYALMCILLSSVTCGSPFDNAEATRTQALARTGGLFQNVFGYQFKKRLG